MPLQLYNTLTRTEEDFRPLDPGGRHVKLYCCGPTVYNFAHIGNIRTFIFNDLLRRHLETRGFDVLHVMNITDVEDKIIRTIHETGESLQILTRKYEAAFIEDLDTVGCLRPKIMPRATEHLPDIIAFVQKLERTGFAYKTADGSVYFSIEKFPSYGRLARLDRDQLKPGERVSQDEHEKESYGDFALWKAYTEKDGAVAWESPWGRGRPGWHIECSCMSMKHLGETIDIHCGGEDLIFPHHEDEIAQSEAATGKPFVRYWLHGAHLLVNGQKMSKSEGNFFTIRDLLAKGYSGREIRYVLGSVHYRLPFNFTLENLGGARQALHRIDTWVERLQKHAASDPAPSIHGKFFSSFSEALDCDLNISEALGQFFSTVRESNRLMDENKLSGAEAAALLYDWKSIESILGLPSAISNSVPPEVMALGKEREEARKAKNWKRSDELRDAIKALGWSVKDSPEGSKFTRLGIEPS